MRRRRPRFPQEAREEARRAREEVSKALSEGQELKERCDDALRRLHRATLKDEMVARSEARALLLAWLSHREDAGRRSALERLLGLEEGALDEDKDEAGGDGSPAAAAGGGAGREDKALINSFVAFLLEEDERPRLDEGQVAKLIPPALRRAASVKADARK